MKSFFDILKKLWPGAIVVSAVGVIKALNLLDPILTLSREYTNANGQLMVDMTTWYNGILILAMLVWTLAIGGYFLQGNENSAIVRLGLIALGIIIFLLLDAPLIPLILVATAELAIFFIGKTGNFHEQGLHEFPTLANYLLLLLGAWILAIG